MDNTVMHNLDDLFSLVPPNQLRKSIHFIFSKYLQTINEQTDLEQFRLIAEDFYFLYEFLERIEEEELNN